MMRKSREVYKAFGYLNLEMMKTNISLARGSHKVHLSARGPQLAGELKNLSMNLNHLCHADLNEVLFPFLGSKNIVFTLCGSLYGKGV